MKTKLKQVITTAASACLVSTCAHASVRYVDLNRANPTPPYISWVTAATNIQDAVDLATAGDVIVVINGVYSGGGGTVAGIFVTNRVAVTNALTLPSVNGPSALNRAAFRKQFPISYNGKTA
jgi:hypothetical protein